MVYPMTTELPSRTPPEESLLWFNGIDAREGGYLTPPVPPRFLADIARGARGTCDWAQARELQTWMAKGAGKARRGLKEGLDPCKLAQAGWGVVFAQSADAAVLCDALSPLLAHRRDEAGGTFRIFAGDDGYRAGDTKVAFLARHKAGAGAADPQKVPYYLLLVGDPEAIPFSFQYQLDVQYAVGRLHFDTLEEYRRYAESVVAAETGGVERRRQAAFFAPANAGDPVSRMTSTYLAQPVAKAVRAAQPGWDVATVLGEQATRDRLSRLLDGRDPHALNAPDDLGHPGVTGTGPAFLFAACHGLSFPSGDPQQREQQGALVCQDWPGPAGRGIAREHYFAGEDVSEQARVHGLVAFCFACFGAGTPRWDDFTQQGKGERRALSSGAFLGRLPQRLLGHREGGALAVVGHVERAWGFSYADAGPQTGTFESTLMRLLAGQPVGWAMEYFNQRYAELASDLAAEVEALGFGKKLDETVLADLWTASHDARNYTIVGDPAVRLAAAAGPDAAPTAAGGCSSWKG